MELSLNKLPWYAQIGAFVIVSLLAGFAYWWFYDSAALADIESRRTQLAKLRAEIASSQKLARQLPEYKAQVSELEQRLDGLRAILPEQKDVADILRRVQGLATQSSLAIQRFTPQQPKQQPLYQELPFKIVVEGRYHDLGAFFDRVSKFPRIINVTEMAIDARQKAEPNGPTIVAECTATTFVFQEAPAKAPAAPKGGARPAAATK